MDEFINKYVNSNIRNVKHTEVEQWLITNNFKGNLVITGKSGCGKHHMINCLINKYPDIQYTIIDDLTKYKSTVSKNDLLLSLSQNNIDKQMLYIIIFANKHGKFISNIKRKSYCIQMRSATNTNLKQLITIICNDKHIQLTSTEVNHIINLSNGDFRQMFNIMYNICKSDIAILNTLQKNGTDDNIYIKVCDMFNNNVSNDHILSYYLTKRILLPLMIDFHYININLPNNVCLDISEQMIIGDYIDSQIFSNQKWLLSELQCFVTCMMPIKMINQCNTRDKLMVSNFPTHLNTVSNYHTYKKNNNIMFYINDLDICDQSHIITLSANKQYILNNNKSFISNIIVKNKRKINARNKKMIIEE